jgi:hypothetical protein
LRSGCATSRRSPQIPTLAAIALLSSPSAAASTIRARGASACRRAVLARQRRQLPPLHIIENDLDSATLAHFRLPPRPNQARM